MYKIRLSFSPDFEALLRKLICLLERQGSQDQSGIPFQKLALSVKETAETLGVSCNITYRLIRAGHLKAVRVGRHWAIPRDALEAFIARDRVASVG